jgi:hypothetical protein
MEATRLWLHVKTPVVSVALKLNFTREIEIAREMERETRQRNRSVEEGGRCLKKNDNVEGGSGAGLDGE